MRRSVLLNGELSKGDATVEVGVPDISESSLHLSAVSRDQRKVRKTHLGFGHDHRDTNDVARSQSVNVEICFRNEIPVQIVSAPRKTESSGQNILSIASETKSDRE